MPDGIEGPREGVPGGIQPEQMRGERGGEEEFLYRGEGREAFLSLEILQPWWTPALARHEVVFRLLSPAEEGDEEISSYIASPVLDALYQRSQGEVRARLTDSAVEPIIEAQRAAVTRIQDEVNQAREQRLPPITQETLQERLKRAMLQQEIIRDFYERRVGVKGEEIKDWEVLYREAAAAVTLQQFWHQREKARGNVDTWVDGLFKAPFARVDMEPGEIADLLDSPEYGMPMETAIETILDVHLEGKIRDARGELMATLPELKVDAKLLAQAKKLPELKNVGEDQEKLVLKNVPVVALKVLQARNNRGLRQGLLEAAIKQQIGQKDSKVDDFVRHRGVLLANHLLEATLLSVWLAAPRRKIEGKREGEMRDKLERWVVDYQPGKIPDTGTGVFGDRGPHDLAKLINFRLHTLGQFERNYQAGPPAQTRVLPEYLSSPFLHDRGAAVYLDNELKVYGEAEKEGKTKVTVLEAWYAANKLRAKQGKEKVGLSQVLRHLPEGATSYWHYLQWRSLQVREALLANVVGGKEDVIDELFLPEKLRAIDKAFVLAFGDREVERELAKINMIATRFISWTKGRNSEIASDSRQEITAIEPTLREIERACRISGFLNEDGWKLVHKVVNKRGALTLEEMRPYREMYKGLVRPQKERRLGDRITIKEVELQLAEVARVDRLVEAFQEELRGIDKTKPEEVERALGQARRKAFA